ncbi:uncharacterized protein F4812DRAFT_358266 [Daldinia caldariorum]|uniref:uncharacterized protein n=1 Tax=Daldinia caldariorum TaxID=326644 RepID=UPI00200776CE|nr:uncharacterized protein F4812DRAFT_358266 [Daldinia caldariorum]KAI1468201.1 hypothetical protein F4812DRAFT_358266 [Daldinia caldariorum]
MYGRAVNASTSASPSIERKRRLACDNCHISKVRCTGELSGCQRCERGNKTCHYSQSNMGRTPGDRANRRRKSSVPKSMSSYINSPISSHQQQQQHDWNSSTSLSSGLGDSEQQIEQNEPQFTTSSVEGNYSVHHQNRSASDSMSISHGPTSQRKHSTTSMLLDNISDDLQSPGFDPLISNFEDIDFSDIDDNHFEVIGTSLDLTFPRFVTPPSPRVSPTQQQQQQQQQQLHATQLFGTSSSTTTSASSYQGPGSGQTPSTPYSSGGDVNYWTAQLDELSRRPHKSPMPLDEVLHQSSQFLPRVTEALRTLPSADPLPSTHMILILVCLTQVITFFEQCMPSVICGLATGGSSGDLSLHLGAYQVDREVQQALQMHIVGRELSSVLQVSKLIKQTLLQPDWNNIPKRTHDLLLEDLQVRTKTLMYQIKQKWSSARRLAL